MVAAVTQVMGRPEQPEYILLEASGVAEPWQPSPSWTKLCQAAFADMLILNKVDLVTRAQIERIRDGSTTGSIVIGWSRHRTEMCLWKS